MVERERPLGELLRLARGRLAEAGVPDPALEARRLLEDFSGLSPTDVLLRHDRLLPPAIVRTVGNALDRRAGGEPLHRILGWREFYGLRLALSPETLEPRPDTETLVDAVLPFLRERSSRGECRILDLGTGTGAIALALLSQLEGVQAVAVDISEGALQTAIANAERLGLDKRFQPLRSDWFSEVSGRFALIVSNPPYIAQNEMTELPRSVIGFDPARALDGGSDGLDAYRVLALQSARHLEADGRVAVEIGYSQRQAVTQIFEAKGFSASEGHRDFGGNDRALVFKPSESA